ncbi:putative membrane protein [Collimonas arenae]|uniref:Putative membrane protein n=1 Tax=Collimonas arenae TaxID=279058 RepID=A0A127PW93_9BURK|nr:putative membrane protein [Collimonas arenae]AMP12006.1 putative membrane protein [Collimonas arenae]
MQSVQGTWGSRAIDYINVTQNNAFFAAFLWIFLVADSL